MKLTSVKSFQLTVTDAEGRVDAVIGSKLASFFELAEYNWMAPRPQSTVGEPSTYVFEMITFLTAYVDSVLIGLNEDIKTRAYRNALARINNWLMVSFALITVSVVGAHNSGSTLWEGHTKVQRGSTIERIGRC